MAAAELLTDLLKKVSRSFYLTLRVLPEAIRPQIGLAYLLARTTDTLADTELVPMNERLAALDQLRARILGISSNHLNLGKFARPTVQPALSPKSGQPGAVSSGASPAERLLLERLEEALAVMTRFSPEDQQRVRAVLNVIISGQELDLRRFGGASRDAVHGTPTLVSLQTEAELDDYAYRVAGCVGEFWTRMCRAHLFPHAPLDDVWLLANGVRFGKGLQLVNILRDVPADLQNGRCYVPEDSLRGAGLTPADLLNPASEPRFRALYQRLLDTAQAHLAAGWEYTNALPRAQVRVRLACAWPLLIGARTLVLLRHRNVLDPAQRMKVSRAEVRGILLRTVLLYPCARSWRNLFPSSL